MEFYKMHGLGNDFIIIDSRATEINLSKEELVRLANRHIGIGCDQLVIIKNSDTADCFMQIYNPDGSESSACGNATRCVAKLTMEQNGSKNLTIQTNDRILECSRIGDDIAVNMGQATDLQEVEIGKGNLQNPMAVNIGNPHIVFFVEDSAKIDLAKEAAPFETHELFPERTNVDVASIIDTKTIKLRVWERGAGATLACGSGACATAIAAYRRGLTANKIQVILPGGVLTIEILENDEIIMSGAAEMVFTGNINKNLGKTS
jgi:diaminopimelate epimerase